MPAALSGRYFACSQGSGLKSSRGGAETAAEASTGEPPAPPFASTRTVPHSWPLDAAQAPPAEAGTPCPCPVRSPLLLSSAAIPYPKPVRCPDAGGVPDGSRRSNDRRSADTTRINPGGVALPPSPPVASTTGRKPRAPPPTHELRGASCSARSVSYRFGRGTSAHRKRPFAPAAPGIPAVRAPFCSFVPPSQLLQNLSPCLLLHDFVHSSHGNLTSGTTYPFAPTSHFRPGNKHPGAIRAASLQVDCR